MFLGLQQNIEKTLLIKYIKTRTLFSKVGHLFFSMPFILQEAKCKLESLRSDNQIEP